MKNPFRVDWDDSIQTVKTGGIHLLKISFKIPEKHILYKDKTQIDFTQLSGLKLIRQKAPAGEKKMDLFQNREVDVYAQDFVLEYEFSVPFEVETGRKSLQGELRYQGCSSDFCYRPVKTPLIIPLNIVSDRAITSSSGSSDTFFENPNKNSLSSQTSSLSLKSLLSSAQPEDLLNLSTPILWAVAFLGGLLTDFTPCVLPIIPLTLAAIGIDQNRRLGRNFLISLMLVLGMAITYAFLGLLSALMGVRLGFLFQSTYFLVFLTAFFLLMSLGMFGVIPLELPLPIRNFLSRVGGAGYRGSFLVGLTIGFVASPCVGPLMGPLLLLVAKKQSLIQGAWVLFLYGFGMGTLFLIAGTFYSTFGSRLRGGYFTLYFKRGLATLMLLPAIYYGYVLTLSFSGGRQEIGWYHSLDEGLQKSRQLGKPVLIDFYADWCPPCLELDRKTFSSPQIQELLNEVVRIKIDCTSETENCEKAVGRFQVIGWPTVLFLNRDHALQQDLSVIGGFVGPDKMALLLEELKKRG